MSDTTSIPKRAKSPIRFRQNKKANGRVRLPHGTKLRVGAINKGGDGVLQFEIQGRFRESWFKNTREIAQ
jgi:hypothetical protein